MLGKYEFMVLTLWKDVVYGSEVVYASSGYVEVRNGKH